MCFSAEASFVSGTVLSVIGIAAIKKNDKPDQLAFAAIPLIFAIQQFTEGILWLTLPDPNAVVLQKTAMYIFLFFAQVVWPTWVPFAVLTMEKDEKRKKTLRFLLIIGLLVSGYLAVRLIMYPAHAEISGHHVYYELGFPVSAIRYFGIMYFIATVIPPFLSGKRKMWMLGLAIFVSYLITRMFYENYVISVWCFFSAIISGTILLVLMSSTEIIKQKHTSEIIN
jgi:hypothetical protein